MARGRGEVGGFTVPAINLRTQVFEMAAAVFRAARARDVGTVILELARSEQEYTFQRPGEFITNVLAGAIAAGWHGPVFVQGDHFQFNAKKYAADPDAVTDGLRRLTVRGAGRRLRQHRHRLVHAGRPVAAHGRRAAAHQLLARGRADRAHPAASSRPARRPASVARSARSARRTRPRPSCAPTWTATGPRSPASPGRRPSASARSACRPARATAASPCPTAASRPSSSTSGRSSGSASWLASTVSPARCSTARRPCPTSSSTASPTVETAEIHLATGFQNLLFDHPAFPADLLAEIDAWCDSTCADERTPDQDEAQFIYKTRKKALGPFKRRLWELPGREAILATQEAKIGYLMEQLKVPGTAEVVRRYIRPVATSRPAPAAVTEVAVV